MATIERAVPFKAATRAERLSRLASRTPLHLALIAIALIWLIPTFGLAVTSFRPESDISATGWWHALIHWHWTMHGYNAVINGASMGHTFLNRIFITMPTTILPLTFGAATAYSIA